MENYERPEVEVVEVNVEYGYSASSLGYSTEEVDYDGESL